MPLEIKVNSNYFYKKNTTTFILDQEEVVKELIRNNPEILNTKIDGDGNLPIHFAVEHGAYR